MKDKYEELLIELIRKDSFGVLVNNFCDKVRGLVAKYKVSIASDLDQIERDILLGKKKITAFDVTARKDEADYLNAFKQQYKSSLISFGKSLRSLELAGKIKKGEASRAMEPFLKLEVE